MRKVSFAVAAAVLLLPAAAEARAVSHGLPATASRCTGKFTIREYRQYASRVHRREHVSARARARLRRLERAACTERRRAWFKRWHRRYARERLARLEVARQRAIAQSLAGLLAAIRQCESGGNYGTDTGNGYYGAYQFDLGTWQSVGGRGNPAHASPAEQDMRAAMLYRQRGAAPWPVCGR